MRVGVILIGKQVTELWGLPSGRAVTSATWTNLTACAAG